VIEPGGRAPCANWLRGACAVTTTGRPTEATQPLPQLSDPALVLLRALSDTARHPREITASVPLLMLVDENCVRVTGDVREIFDKFFDGIEAMCDVEILPLGRRVLRADSKGELTRPRVSMINLAFDKEVSVEIDINEQGVLTLRDEKGQVAVPTYVEVGSGYERVNRTSRMKATSRATEYFS
jgi:hypothetical protein